MKTNFMGKCYAGMNGMVAGMKRSNLNWKQDGKAAEAEKTIHTMTREIGSAMLLFWRPASSWLKPRPERSTQKLSARTAARRAAPGCTTAAGAAKLSLMKHSPRKLIKRIQSEGGSPSCLPFSQSLIKESAPEMI